MPSPLKSPMKVLSKRPSEKRAVSPVNRRGYPVSLTYIER